GCGTGEIDKASFFTITSTILESRRPCISHMEKVQTCSAETRSRKDKLLHLSPGTLRSSMCDDVTVVPKNTSKRWLAHCGCSHLVDVQRPYSVWMGLGSNCGPGLGALQPFGLFA